MLVPAGTAAARSLHPGVSTSKVHKSYKMFSGYFTRAWDPKVRICRFVAFILRGAAEQQWGDSFAALEKYDVYCMAKMFRKKPTGLEPDYVEGRLCLRRCVKGICRR